MERIRIPITCAMCLKIYWTEPARMASVFLNHLCTEGRECPNFLIQVILEDRLEKNDYKIVLRE